MSRLPEIPDEAIREAEVMIGLDTWTRSPTCGLCRRPEACPEHAGESLLHAAWPYLYAAALRHAADRFQGEVSDDHVPDVLRRMADEATP